MLVACCEAVIAASSASIFMENVYKMRARKTKPECRQRIAGVKQLPDARFVGDKANAQPM